MAHPLQQKSSREACDDSRCRKWSTCKRIAVLALASVLLSYARTAEASGFADSFAYSMRRERILRSDDETLQVGMSSLIDQGSKIQVCKVDVTERASCGDFLGNSLPCPISPGNKGVVNYTVAQGDSLKVSFSSNSSSLVIMGGAKNGGFAQDAPCQVSGTLGAAVPQPIASSSLTGFTFAPTRAVCPSFVNNTQGQLSVYVFDTSDGSGNVTNGHYLASACRFTINLTIEKAADAPIREDQFYHGSSQMTLG